jgi:hypothetical protein
MRRIENNIFAADVIVPPNTTGEMTLPVTGEVMENGEPAKGRPGVRSIDKNRLETGSGAYRFTATL